MMPVTKQNEPPKNRAGDLLFQVTGAATIVGGSCSSTRSTASSVTVKAGPSGAVQIQVTAPKDEKRVPAELVPDRSTTRH